MQSAAYYTFHPRPDQPERYDQQSAFVNSKTHGVKFLIGGNGAGTSEICCFAAAQFLLTTPPPRKDTPFWVIGGTYEQVCKALWKEKFSPRTGHGHLPDFEIDWERIRWYRPNQGWPFEVPLRNWPGFPDRNWSLNFKSYEQGQSAMMAEAIGGFLFSEQFPWGLLEEVLRGCREYSFPGSKMAEFTPIMPELYVELEERIENDTLPPGWEIYRANTECALEAGHVSKEWFDQFFGLVSDDMRLTRMIGASPKFHGVIYNINPAIHFCDEEDAMPGGNFPDGVHFMRCIDWGAGPANPFCCLWLFKSGWGQWTVFDEYYSADQEKTLIDHLCEVVDRWPWPKRNPQYGQTWADPSDPGNIRIASRLPDYAPGYDYMTIRGARNSVNEGIEHVQYLLKPRFRQTAESKPQPMLRVVKARCPNLCRELRTYRWLAGSGQGINPRDPQAVPLKRDDHSVDALRYGLFSEGTLSGITPSSMNRSNAAQRHGVRHERNGGHPKNGVAKNGRHR